MAKKLSSSIGKATTKKLPPKAAKKASSEVAAAKSVKIAAQKPKAKSVAAVEIKSPKIKAKTANSDAGNAKAALKRAKTEKQAASTKKANPKAGKSAQKLKEIAIGQLSDLGKKWLSLYQTADESSAVAYDMKESYEAQTAIFHQSLGWGFILSKNNDRLEVIFKDGIRHLISNYRR